MKECPQTEPLPGRALEILQGSRLGDEEREPTPGIGKPPGDTAWGHI